jgi:hypothetical protein
MLEGCTHLHDRMYENNDFLANSHLKVPLSFLPGYIIFSFGPLYSHRTIRQRNTLQRYGRQGA